GRELSDEALLDNRAGDLLLHRHDVHDGQSAMNAVDGLLDGGGDGIEAAGVAELEVAVASWVLGVRDVVEVDDVFLQALELDVFCDADNFEEILGPLRSDVIAVADGRDSRREESFGDVLADDGDVLRGRAVLRAEVTLSDERDLHGVEEAVADDVVLD